VAPALLSCAPTLRGVRRGADELAQACGYVSGRSCSPSGSRSPCSCWSSACCLRLQVRTLGSSVDEDRLRRRPRAPSRGVRWVGDHRATTVACFVGRACGGAHRLGPIGDWRRRSQPRRPAPLACGWLAGRSHPRRFASASSAPWGSGSCSIRTSGRCHAHRRRSSSVAAAADLQLRFPVRGQHRGRRQDVRAQRRVAGLDRGGLPRRGRQYATWSGVLGGRRAGSAPDETTDT
jgi:hypothetical protein